MCIGTHLKIIFGECILSWSVSKFPENCFQMHKQQTVLLCEQEKKKKKRQKQNKQKPFNFPDQLWLQTAI